MNFLITMAGKGTRFKNAGYSTPKWKIITKGKSLFEWSLGSLPLSICTKLIFIIQKDESKEYQFYEFLQQFDFLKNINKQLIEIEFITNGQAETAYLAKDYINNEQPLLIFNIDTRFTSKNLSKELLKPNCDGILGAFKSQKNNFSYASIDNYGLVKRTVEKEVISENALNGLYHFTKGLNFIKAYELAINENKIVSSGEYYIAPLYNGLIAKGLIFRLCFVDSIDILGTPEEIECFEKNENRF